MIANWDSKHDKFWFQFSKENTAGPRQLVRSTSTLFKTKTDVAIYHFISPQAELINDLMCDWVEELGLMNEGEYIKGGPKRKTTRNTQRD